MFNDDFIIYTLTPVMAFVGAVLGIVNMVMEWKSHRLIMHVSLSSDGTWATLSMVNMSYFPVTIKAGGFLNGRSRYQFCYGPLRLESRDVRTCTTYVEDHKTDASGQVFTTIAEIQNATRVYVELADGKLITSSKGVNAGITGIAAELEKRQAKKP